MATKINLEYFGMPGQGETVKEAKLDAGRKIEQLVTESANGPRLLVFGSSVSLLVRTPYGWYAPLLTSGGQKTMASGPVFGGCHYDTLDEAMVASMKHLAHLEWSCDVGNDTEFFTKAQAELPRRLQCPSDLRDMVEYAEWQRRYRRAVNSGATGAQARHCADFRVEFNDENVNAAAA